MELINNLIGSNKYEDPCFLCFKNDKKKLNIHTVFEIHNNCEVISLSVQDMFKKLFPVGDLIFRHACLDCLDLITELYILLHNRESKLVLLDCIIQQLAIKTNAMCGNTGSNDKLVLNVHIPSDQDMSSNDLIHNINNENQPDNESNTETTNSNRNSQTVKICQYCPDTFLQLDELRSHLKIHRKKRLRRRIYHYCNDCNYKTLSKTTLQAHINKHHLNTRPHICQVCYKGFYNKSNLNEHVKTHNNQRNQICELCGCSFIHKKSLIEHLRLHSDIRPYKCDICHKSFVTSGRRSDHFKRSHMEKSESCLICNKKYSLRKELTRHMNNVH